MSYVQILNDLRLLHTLFFHMKHCALPTWHSAFITGAPDLKSTTSPLTHILMVIICIFDVSYII